MEVGKRGEIRKPWRAVEDRLAIGALGLMAALPLVEIVGRRIGFGNVIPGSILLVQHLTLLTAVIGGALAARRGRLLALSTATFLPQALKAPAQLTTAALGAGVCACLTYASWTFARVEREAGETIALGIPVWTAVAAMAPGFALIGIRMAWSASPSWTGRLAAASGR